MSQGSVRAALNAVERLAKRNSSASYARRGTNSSLDPPKRTRSPGRRQLEKTPVTTPFIDTDSSQLSYSALEVPGQAPVPALANKLDRVLFSPGVHFLKDPRTNVYNFDSRLEQIMSITDFDFSRLAPYVPAGRDSVLSQLAADQGKTYTGSTSSLTPVLTQLHHALSHQRPPQIVDLPKYFPSLLTSFSATQRAPTEFWLVRNPKTQTYAVSASGSSQELILTLLGHAMETMLTTESGEFAKWSKRSTQSPESPPVEGSTYNYTQLGSFLMRSQLDCHDSRLPGTGMFDLKTRACCAIRHDIDYAQVRDGSDYQILKLSGEYESFSREFYELVRSAMFKYSLQARIGRMDGIFVAYHNVRQLFGFQYLPLDEIDKIYHSAQLVPAEGIQRRPPSTDNIDLERQIKAAAPIIADAEFKLSVEILSSLLDELRARVPSGAANEGDINVVMHCDRPGSLVVFAVPGSYSSKTSTGGSALLSETTLPESMRAFRIRFRQSVNGRNVPEKMHPSLTSANDVWRVSASIEPMNPSDASHKWAQTVASYVRQELTSTPRTDDVTETELATMLAKLPEATDLQTLLRKLDEDGAAYKRWDEQRPKIHL